MLNNTGIVMKIKLLRPTMLLLTLALLLLVGFTSGAPKGKDSSHIVFKGQCDVIL